MNVGILGSGGREHAICFSIKKSKNVKNIYCLPGNAGTSAIAENIQINISDFNAIKKFTEEKKIFRVFGVFRFFGIFLLFGIFRLFGIFQFLGKSLKNSETQNLKTICG